MGGLGGAFLIADGALFALGLGLESWELSELACTTSGLETRDSRLGTRGLELSNDSVLETRDSGRLELELRRELELELRTSNLWTPKSGNPLMSS